jgi:hypothetical protein
MKYSVLILFFLGLQKINAQEFEVKSIVFCKNSTSNDFCNIPILIDKTGKKDTIANKINNQLKKEFDIESFDIEKNNKFNWVNIQYESEIKDGYLLIFFWGEYIGYRLSEVKTYLLFDLNSGNKLPYKTLNYSLLFSNIGYFKFLEKYWTTKIKKTFDNAYECSGDLYPKCSQFNIDFYAIKNNSKQIGFSLINDTCFPRNYGVVCNPEFNVQLPIIELNSMLNDFGKLILLNSNYLQKSRLEQYLYLNENKQRIPNKHYIQGKINRKYKFNMAFEINRDLKSVEGMYYYEKHNIPIKLKGKIEIDKIFLNEIINNKQNNQFEFYLIEDSIKIGQWINTKNQIQEIEIIDTQQ